MKYLIFLVLLALVATSDLSAQIDSAKYILNRTGPTQVANFNIAGFGGFVHNGSNNFSGTLLMQSVSTAGGVNLQLTGDAQPGFATWMHNGTGFVEQMRILSNGFVGIGQTAPIARLHVTGAQGTAFAKFTQSNISPVDGVLTIGNGTTGVGNYIPNIVGRTYMPGRSFGVYFTGEAEDVLPTVDNGMAAVVLDGRSKTSQPLVTNNVLAVNSAGVNLMQVKANGSVAIGTTDTKGYKLAVNGSGIFTKVVVKSYANWPDFVFHPDYKLPALSEVEQFVTKNQHLPGIPSASEIEKEGVDVGEMNKQLLQKVEEQMLYIIEMNKQLAALSKEVEVLKQKIATKYPPYLP